MKFLRALLRLPWLFLTHLWASIYWVTRLLGRTLSLLLGTVSWQAPAWLRAIKVGLITAVASIRRYPRRASAAVGILALSIGGGWFGYCWYRDRPRPPEPVVIHFNVTPPSPTDFNYDPITIYGLEVEFSGSVAPLEVVGKTATAGIRVSPELDGTWTWKTDRSLRFWPKDDWPVGKHYQVSFDRAKAFAPQVRVEQDRFEFDSPAFTATIGNTEFYQDPQDAAHKKAIIQVNFSHPVDTAELEKRIALSLTDAKGKSTPRKFVVNYDRRKLIAYVNSEPLSIPKDESQLNVTLDKGIRAARGGPGIETKLAGKIAIPGLYSLNIANVNATLVDNERFEPEQVLVVEASQAVSERDISKDVTAWVLPVFHPNTPEKERTQPYDWSVADVSEAILHKSEHLTLDAVPAEREYTDLHSFKYHADSGRYVYVQVAKGLKSFGGYVLGKLSSSVVKVPEYQKMLRFMAEGSLLSLNGDKRVSIVARNVPGMQMEIARVLPDQLQHLVTMNYGSYSHPELLGTLSADHITERFEQKIPFSAQYPKQAHYEGIDLSHYLGEGSNTKHGVFLLKLSVFDPKANKPKAKSADSEDSYADDELAEGDAEEYDGEHEDGNTDYSDIQDTRLVAITDLGVVTKKSLDGSQDVFVQSIHSGEPVGEASVEVIAKNGQSLQTQITDHEGRAHFAALEGYTREKTPAMYIVRKGEDLSFLPVTGYDRRLDFSRFDIGGIKNAKDAGKLSAYLFSDRGLYRPGDTFHVGMIVRAADWAKPLVGIPLEAEILDPRGLSVERRKLRLTKAGFEELSYTTQENAPSGAWTVNLSLIKDNGTGIQLGSVSVQVKNFLPDRMKASAHLSQKVPDGWIKPDNLSARVTLQNLFGTPAQNRRVEASLTLSPVFPAFRGYPNYTFFDPQRAKEGYSEPLGAQTTGADGEAIFPLDLSKYGTATYRLHFLAKGFEAEGGRSVAAEVMTLVSSLDYLIGAKTDGALDYVSRDSQRGVHLIAIDPKTQSINVEGLKAALIERRYISILTKQDSGVYKYESKLKEVPINEKPLTIPVKGLDYALPTTTPGNFSLVIRNAQGDELNRIDYSVAGDANLTRSLDRNAELQLSLSKHDYAPGEDIEIAIRAPYAGSGLITIERDKVFAHSWFKAATSGSVQKIRVPADFEGNGYVNVQFIRDPSSDEIFMSPLSYGVVPFSVNRDARKNVFKVAIPAMVKPGETLNMKVTTTKPARIAVFVVDEGILQVARYKLGDPLDFFFRKRMLEVQTSQILDLILPEFNKLVGMAAPGGDADNMLGRHLNPFRRKHQQAVAYWSGIIDVDGERELHYDIPNDFNGRLRVMAVSVSTDRIGTFEDTTTARGDFVLSPNVPAMVAPGDEFEVSVGVSNNLTNLGGKEIPIMLHLQPSAQLEVIGASQQELKLGEMREGAAIFRLRAKGEPGAASIAFTASSGDKSAKLSTDLSVRPGVPYRTEVTVGNLDKGTAEVKPLRQMFDAFAKREASASHVPLVLARGLASYLADFPHQCTEQLLSQGMPALVLDQRPEFGQVHTKDNMNSADSFTNLLQVLRSRQNAEGGFGLWMATPEPVRFVSAYAMHFLLEAKERGRKVPADILTSGNNYLQQLAADESDASLAGLRDRTYAIYLLTRQGTVTTNQLAAVRQHLDEKFANKWHDDTAAAYLAATLRLLKEDKEAAKLIAGPQRVLERKAEEAAYHYEYYYDPLIRDAGTLYLLAKHFPDRMQALSAEALQNLVRPLRKGHYNTLSSAMTVLALDTYANQLGTKDQDHLSISEVHADGKEQDISKQQGLVNNGIFDASAQALRVHNDADLAAWYTVTQSGYDRNLPTQAIKEGLEVVRDYTDADGKPVDKVKLGEEIQVHLKIRATRADGLSNIAVVDLLPGGFEPVQEIPAAPTADGSPGEQQIADTKWHSSVGLSRSTWQLDYADVRDDRVVIYGYASKNVTEFIYRIKATNAGTFIVPPAYGESMYDRTVQAQSLGGRIVVEKP